MLCITCDQDKEMDDFPRAGKNGRHRKCKPCWAAYMREWNARNPHQKRRHACKKYGITPEDFENLLERQGGLCAMCGEPESLIRAGQVQRLSIDHDHATGEVRGLLCNSCNVMLAQARDDVTRLENAIRYLNDRKVA